MEDSETNPPTSRDRRPSILRRFRDRITSSQSRDENRHNSAALSWNGNSSTPSVEAALEDLDITEYADTTNGQKSQRSVLSSLSTSNTFCEQRYDLEHVSSGRSRGFSRLDIGHAQLQTDERRRDGSRSPQQSCASYWLRRTTSLRFRRRRRPSAPNMSLMQAESANASHPEIKIPEVNLEYPSYAPNPTGGAAARAAAAAQNEMLETARSSILRDSSRLVEPKFNNDSESGIGIDLRDRFDEMDTSLPLTRTDPGVVLPEELLAHVMSYLDAASLMRAESVSHRWHNTAISYHVWKYIFWQEYNLSYQLSAEGAPLLQVGGLGLGKNRPNQEWKQMWKVRKMLEARWINAQAAAIYLEGHKDSVYCVQFDENKILTGSRDRTIRVWDARTYECIKVLGVPKNSSPPRVHEPRPNPTNRKNHPTVSIVPARTIVELTPTFTPSLYHDGSILCLQFDQEIMVTGSSDHTCIVWDMKDDYKAIRRLRHHSAGVLDVCFDDKHIVSCSKDTTICLWDRQTGDLRRTFAGHRGPVNAVQLRGNLIVSASGDGIAKLWNLVSGLCIKEFPSRDRGMACVEFSPDSRTILAGGNDMVIYHFDANSGELVRELKGHKGLVRSLHLDSANGRVISGSYDTSVKAYDLKTGDMICDFEGWTTSWMLSAKADYRRICATSQDSRAIIMDFGHQLPGIELLEG